MEAAEALADLVAHHPEPLFTTGVDGTLELVSRSLAQILGPDAKVGTRLADRVHPDDRAVFDAAWARLGESVEAGRFEIRVKVADGAYRRVACSARRSPERGVVHGCLREIGPIDESARALKGIIESLPIIVMCLDRSGLVTFHDGKALAAMGITPGQYLGKNLFELYPQTPREDVEDIFAGNPKHMLIEAHGVPVEIWSIPLRDPSGEITSIMIVTLDITNARRAEVELRDKLALIERQQAVINALSTPIIEVWDKVLTLPMVGIIDSTRAGQVMEQVLTHISAKGARFAILDLTGVEAVDTGTAAHLLKLIQAIRLLGAEGVITGIRPSVAQTMVTLGVDMETIVTCANLQQGLRHCIKRMREEAALPGKDQRGPS